MNERERWENDKRNGTLDDPIDPNWKVPSCSCCSRRAHYAVMPTSIAMGTLMNPPYNNAKFYCPDHYVK